ncbi:hypothetical protein Tco_0760797 [Tanacetum coccineum]
MDPAEDRLQVDRRNVSSKCGSARDRLQVDTRYGSLGSGSKPMASFGALHGLLLNMFMSRVPSDNVAQAQRLSIPIIRTDIKEIDKIKDKTDIKEMDKIKDKTDIKEHEIGKNVKAESFLSNGQ